MRFLNLFRRAKLDAQLDDELAFHLEQLTAEFIRKGLSPAEAAREARRQFGNLAVHREAYQDQRGVPWLSDAFATSSYGTNFAHPLSAATFVSDAVNVVFPWSMCPIVPTFTCGFERSNFSFAICVVCSPPSPLPGSGASDPVLLPCCPTRVRLLRLQPQRNGLTASRVPCLADVHHFSERRLEPMTRIELVTSSLPRTCSAN